MPFGYGARLCLGKAFALAEIKLLVAGIVMEYELRDDPESATTEWTMQQLGTQNAMPRGQRCDLRLRRLTEWERKRGGDAGCR
jgi:cytochrome P450